MIKHTFSLTAAFVIFIYSNLANANSDSPILTPFSAEFSLKKKGIAIGHITITLSREGDYWRYQTNAKPHGLISLFSKSKVFEYSLSKLEDNKIIPHKFFSSRITKKHDQVIEIQYDAKNHIAFITSNGNKQQINLSEPHHDTSSIQIALIRDVQSQFNEKHYNIIDKNEVKKYTFKYEDQKRISTKLGDTDCIKVSRVHGNRKTVTCYSPKHHYIPIQISEYKNGKLHGIMKLRNLSISK